MRSARGQNPQPVGSIAARLHSAAIHLLRRVRSEDTASGLSPARLSALSVLVFGGPCTLGQLAAAEQVKPPTTSRLVAALEAEGLVRRQSDAQDGRAVIISATPRGRRLLEEGRGRRVAHLARLLARLSAEELELLERATTLLEGVTRGAGVAPSASG